MTQWKYVVLHRFKLKDNREYVTIIMVLEDEEKANKLAEFLNIGGYFESEVTVESRSFED